MKYLFLLGSLIFCSLHAHAHADEQDPIFKVTANGQTHAFHLSELLKSKFTKKITLTEDPHYPQQSVIFEAIPAKALFDGVTIPENSTVEFTASDGFSGVVESKRFFNEEANQSHAYIAIESPEHKWKKSRPKDPTDLGPFYLVWENPKASQIVGEEWPYQLVSLELKTDIASQFPHLQPDAKLSANDPVRRGMKIFLQNCFSCHTLNREGTSHMGPDLNVPYNPTEYFKADFFEKYVRSVESVHVWPENKMSTFPKDALSDSDFKDLKAYLTHMSKHKVAVK